MTSIVVDDVGRVGFGEGCVVEPFGVPCGGLETFLGGGRRRDGVVVRGGGGMLRDIVSRI